MRFEEFNYPVKFLQSRQSLLANRLELEKVTRHLLFVAYFEAESTDFIRLLRGWLGLGLSDQLIELTITLANHAF